MSSTTNTNDDPFQQSQFITGIHNIPRFGHSNHISKLASFQRSEQVDYVRGVLGFVVFASLMLYVWGVVLIGLKFILSSTTTTTTTSKNHTNGCGGAKIITNCAAGGSLMDVAKLRKARIPKHQRRRLIIRSWRVQNVFLIASMMIPIATLLMTRNGLRPLINSLDEVESISDEVEAVAYRGIAIAESLQKARFTLQTNFTDTINLNTDICPNLKQRLLQTQLEATTETTKTITGMTTTTNSSLVLPIDTLTQYISIGLGEVKGFIDQYATEATIGLHRVIGVTTSLDTTIGWIYRNDWMLKFFLLTINVVNSFFLVGVFLSKQDLVFHSYQRFLSYTMIPTLCLLLLCSLITSFVFGMSAMVNADFCYGNTIVDGTMHDIIVKSGVEETDLTYQAFMHYMEGCLGDHPLDFIHGLDSVIRHTKNAVALLEWSLYSISNEEEHVKRDCTDGVFVLISSTPHLTSILTEVQRQVRAVIELTGCHQINPVLRRIRYGVTCSDTVDALTWLFSGMWCITLLGFTMLTVRAALHNAVVRAPRRKRQREREKEFEEYKQYMADFYEDADRWQLDAPPPKLPPSAKKDNDELPPDTIPHVPTFETEDTSSVSPRHDGDASDVAYFASPRKKSDDYSSESSYESDYSSDSNDDDYDDQRSNMSFSVLVGRMFHTQRQHYNLDESQSRLPGISMLSHDTMSPSRATPRRRPLGILELQTPRRRVVRPSQQMPSPILPLPSSPTSPRLLPPLSSPFGNDNSSSEGSSMYVSSPPWKTSMSVPMAPAKPRRKVYRTKGGKES